MALRKKFEVPAGRENFNETRDCTVVATAAATGVTYAEAHKFLAAHGRKQRKGMYFADFMAGRKELLGWKVVPVPIQPTYKYTTRFGQTRARWVYPTLASLVRKLPKGRYLANKRGHAFAVVDGVLLDATRMTGKSRVRNMWKLEGKTLTPADLPFIKKQMPKPVAPVAPAPAPVQTLPWAVQRYIDLRAAGQPEAARKLFDSVTAKVQQQIIEQCAKGKL